MVTLDQVQMEWFQKRDMEDGMKVRHCLRQVQPERVHSHGLQDHEGAEVGDVQLV